MPKKKKTAREKAEQLQALYDRQNAYAKNKYQAYSLRLDKNECADVIEKLNSVPNKNEYIITLVRADINNN